MNDTTRQMGGALGVAVIGSIVASSYRPGVASGISALHLSPGVVASAKDSVGGAVDAAKSLPSGAAHALTTLAHAQFVDAFTGALQIAAVVVLLAAGVAFSFLPARAGDAREPVEGPLDGLASLTFAEAEGLLEVDAAAGRAP